MKKQKRRCKHCRCLFNPCTKVAKHEYCSKKQCQKARKSAWQKKKMDEDAVYRKDQEEAQKLWQENNPDYWQKYRERNKKYADRNRQRQKDRNRAGKLSSTAKPRSNEIAKMDALNPKKQNLSGRYKLIPLSVKTIANMDALIVKIDVIKEGCWIFGS